MTKTIYDACGDALRARDTRIAALEAENERLREALRRFSWYSTRHPGFRDSEKVTMYVVTDGATYQLGTTELGAFRDAARALGEEETHAAE